VLGTPDSLAQVALQRSIEAYLAVFRAVADEYRAVSAVIHDHPYPLPSLWYFSDADFTASPADVRRVTAKWNANHPTMPVTEVLFNASPHVSHLPHYPETYEANLAHFFQHRTDLPLLPPSS